jgi:hypothetical protein
MDRYIIYHKSRWVSFVMALLLYIYRVTSIGGYYVISYILALHLLQLLIQFLTPLGVPDLDEVEDDQFPDCKSVEYL